MPLPPQEPPDWLNLFRDHIPSKDRQWYHRVPVTTPARTIIDVAHTPLNPEFFFQALDEAQKRGMIPPDFERRVICELMDGRRFG